MREEITEEEEMNDDALREVSAALRADGRIQLTALSRKTGVPVSTLYDALTQWKSKGVLRVIGIIDEYAATDRIPDTRKGYSCNKCMAIVHSCTACKRDLAIPGVRLWCDGLFNHACSEDCAMSLFKDTFTTHDRHRQGGV